MKKIFLLLLIVPAAAAADTYQDAAGTSQMLADSITDFWDFTYSDWVQMVQRFYAWALVWFVKAKLYAELESMKFAWGVAKIIIEDLQIMSQITAQMSALPVDVRQALVDMRVFDGINILLNAYVTKFVLRIIG